MKIADFGLAKQNRNTATRGVGTLAYMPPELFSDEDELGREMNLFAVDIYAIGVILWELWYRSDFFLFLFFNNVARFSNQVQAGPL